MPKFKKHLGFKPPVLLKPRSRETSLRASFVPSTLQRDAKIQFTVGQEKDAEKWLKLQWGAALREEKKASKARAEGRHLSATMSQCIERALKRGIRLNTEKRISQRTMNAYEDSVDLFLRWLVDKKPGLAPFRINDIDRELITEYVGHRTSNRTDRIDEQKREPPTERAMYKQVMGIQWAILRGAPMHHIEEKHYSLVPRGLSGKSQPRAVYLNGTQMTRYFKAIHELGHHGLLAMTICQALLGMRRGDALGLSLRSFSEVSGYRYVMIEKASKGRTRGVILLPEVHEMVNTFVLPALPIKLQWKCGADSIYHPLRAAAKKAGVPYAAPNDLRASFSVLLLNRGIPATIVAEMMGTSVQMLESHYDRANEVGISLERQRVKLEAARAAGHFVGILPGLESKALIASGRKG